ncbi:uncharacterized protein [Ptychodera flava]|uniref:uncharacterized protein n=1 Tax=Ptychodera flava TaxID=63121 RepID=UPI00396A3B58
MSKTFQHGLINYAHIQPTVSYIKDKLADVRENNVPIELLKIDLSKGGRLELLELHITEENERYLKSLSGKYITTLIENIDNRLDASLPILNAFSIFDPSGIPTPNSLDFREYGNESLNILVEKFLRNKKDDILDKVHAEWGKLKYDILSWKSDMDKSVSQNKHTSPIEWCLVRLMKMKSSYGHFYPEIVQIAEGILSLPVSNAWPERGVSKVRLIKDRLRSRMKNDLLNALLHITINGPELFSNECDTLIEKATKKWLAAKKRRKLPTIAKVSDGQYATSSTSSSAAVVELVDTGMQTEPQTLDELREEVQVALKALNVEAKYGHESESEGYDSDYDSE